MWSKYKVQAISYSCVPISHYHSTLHAIMHSPRFSYSLFLLAIFSSSLRTYSSAFSSQRSGISHASRKQMSPSSSIVANNQTKRGTRRDVFQIIISGACSSFIIPNTLSKPSLTSQYKANASLLPFTNGNGDDKRRQLELCTATVLRVGYWAENVALAIQGKIDNGPVTTDIMKAPYLEARLGGKAALTGKIGGGANAKVYALASFQLRGCVKDAVSHYNELYKTDIKAATTSDEKSRLKLQKAEMDRSSEDIIESLAALVEFDGLDNVQDPSPRSTLALAQYTDAKAKYIKRILLERTVPACNSFVGCFGSDRKRLVEAYVARTYRDELPARYRVDDGSASASATSIV